MNSINRSVWWGVALKLYELREILFTEFILALGAVKTSLIGWEMCKILLQEFLLVLKVVKLTKNKEEILKI